MTNRYYRFTINQKLAVEKSWDNASLFKTGCWGDASPKLTHPKGESLPTSQNPFPENIAVDTYDGKTHIKWNSEAPVTPIG